MRLLEEFAQTFTTSRPIFQLTADEDRRTISFNESRPVHKYVPEYDSDDVIQTIVAEHYKESFDVGSRTFVVDHYKIANEAMEEIRRHLAVFLERNLEMKNPRQSKLYKWFGYEMPNTYEFNGHLVSLYKYVRSFTDSEMRGSNVEHIKNAIAVMEAIKEKMSEK